MRREKIRRPRPAPLKRGPLVLLGDGVLLFLVLAGAVGSFCTAFTLDVSLPLVYAGCALCALIFLAVWSLPRRWWALPLAVCAGLWGAALWRMWDGLALGEVSVRCSVVNTFCRSLGLDGMIQPAAELPADTWTAAATLLVLLVTVPLGALLGLGIGDTFRVTLTADPVEEIVLAKKILKAVGLRKDGPELISCPTCGRTQIDLIPMAHKVEELLKGVDKPITVAVMGCVVNGPGEARHADVGIAGGKGEGVLFLHGEIVDKVPEDQLIPRLMALIDTL